MSYIRSLSNPESLYIWCEGKETAISHGVKGPLSSARWRGGKASPPFFHVPAAAFDRVCALWGEGREPARAGGIRVEEVALFVATGKMVPVDFYGDIAKVFRDKRRVEHLIRLSYRKHFVCMWRVTWEYVVRNSAWRRRCSRPSRTTTRETARAHASAWRRSAAATSSRRRRGRRAES